MRPICGNLAFDIRRTPEMKRAALASFAALAVLTAPAHAQDAEAAFKSAFADACMLDEDRVVPEYFSDESWVLTWGNAENEYSATLYQFYCFSGAYNVNYVYYIKDEWDGVEPVSFAVPAFDVKYKDDDYDSEVESIKVTGFTTLSMLTNAAFDPETGTINNTAHWRGLGDASSGGRWVFDEGQFVLKSYDVDPSYDGEINPRRIVEYK
jgi:hypothetical protein